MGKIKNVPNHQPELLSWPLSSFKITQIHLTRHDLPVSKGPAVYRMLENLLDLLDLVSTKSNMFLSHYFYIMWITWDLGLRDGRLGKLGHRRLENQFQTIGLPSEFLKPKRLRRGMRTSCWGEGFSDQQIVGYLVALPCFFLIFRQTIIIRMEGTLQCSHNNPFRLYVLNIF